MIGLLVLLALLANASAHAQTDDQQTELERLQQELKARQQSLASNKASAEELQDILQASEKDIGNVARALNQTETELTQNRQDQKQLTLQRDELLASIKQQQSLLAGQLRSAFMAGHYDYAKMLFYQDDAKTFERVITYYQYLSKARKEQITSFRNKVTQLEQVNAQLEAKAERLAVLLNEQIQQQKELSARQRDRQQTLAKLSAKIASDQSRIAALQKAEQDLVAAIEQAQREAQQSIELSGLADAKGKLLVPAKGSVRKLFGKRRQGQIRWKGIIIDGREGSEIQAISHGRVIYADWLRGFGLVTVIDHGEGYMSVYGHNQALLKQAGDNVSRGETIALLGQSGGQSSPNLYFEIRHKGKALNPSSWIRY